MGSAERFELCREPLAGNHLRPFGAEARPVVLAISLQVGPGQETQGLGKADPTGPDAPLDVAPLVEHGRELVAVDLDPPTLDEGEALGGGEQGLHVPLGEPLAVQGQPGVEAEHGVETELRRRLPAHRDRDLGSGSAAGASPVRHADGPPQPARIA